MKCCIDGCDSEVYVGDVCMVHNYKYGMFNTPLDKSKQANCAYCKHYKPDGEVKECPGKPRLTKGDTWAESFEKGGGGFGYNMTYLGSRLWQKGMDWQQSYRMTTKMAEVKMPANTLMFADSAMSINGQLIEYSFAEQPFVVSNGMTFDGDGMMKMYTSPSIHFRHRGRACVAWADGHVGDMKMSQNNTGKNAYGDDSFSEKLGWFDPLDNSLFDLK